MKRFLVGALASLAFLALGASSVWAAVKTETLSYTGDGVTMTGTLAYDDASTAKRPVVLLFHDAAGQDASFIDVAKEFAEQGYLAFAATYYASGETGPLADDAKLLARARAAYTALTGYALADPTKVAIAGGSLGGNATLLLAESGVVCSFIGTVSGYVSHAVNVSGIQATVARFIHTTGDSGTGQDLATFTALANQLKAAGKNAEVSQHPGGHEPRNHAFWLEMEGYVSQFMPSVVPTNPQPTTPVTPIPSTSVTPRHSSSGGCDAGAFPAVAVLLVLAPVAFLRRR